MMLFSPSSIVAGGYDARSGTLRLRYIDGDTYDYRNVPSTVLDDLLPVHSGDPPPRCSSAGPDPRRIFLITTAA
jgi:hypothetical protein